MGKTFDQSLIDTANIPMSMIDPEDMADTTSEEFISMRRVQQGCHSELTNREDFPFNKYTKTIQLSKGQDAYSMPDGRITQVRISNGNSINKVDYDPDLSLYAARTAKPDVYTITYNPNKVKLYPTPDKSYTVSIDYNSTKNVILPNGQYSYEIAVGSTLRMPEQFQHLYFDALEYYVLYTNMRKVSNPRWQPTYEIFKQKWATFLRGINPVESETVFLI
jgi:hypothetical protein